MARRSLLVWTATLVGTVGFLQWCAWYERPSSYYPDLASYEADGVNSRAWLPDSLPPSAKDIREAHDIDTNESWIRFQFARADSALLTKWYTPTSWSAVSAPRDAGWWVRWWDLPTGDASRRELAVYIDESAPQSPLCLAVNWKAATAYGWSCARAG
jgi:hypothetical protein